MKTNLNLNAGYDKTYGMWNVSTEGDVEGRSLVNLGTYEGHIDEIALHLANKAYYSLKFSAVSIPKTLPPTGVEANVNLDIASNTWDMDWKKLLYVMKNLFEDRPVTIEPGQYYASFKIVSNDKELIQMDKIKDKKPSELSSEELEFLLKKKKYPCLKS